MPTQKGFYHICKRCKNEWYGKLENPKVCPKCNSPYWDKDRLRLPLEKRFPTAEPPSPLGTLDLEIPKTPSPSSPPSPTSEQEEPRIFTSLTDLDLVRLKYFCVDKLAQGQRTVRGVIDDPLF